MVEVGFAQAPHSRTRRPEATLRCNEIFRINLAQQCAKRPANTRDTTEHIVTKSSSGSIAISPFLARIPSRLVERALNFTRIARRGMSQTERAVTQVAQGAQKDRDLNATSDC